MDEVKIMQVIYCTKKRRGKGVEFDPIRIVTEIFDVKGNLIAENDDCMVFSKADLYKFAKQLGHTDKETVDAINKFENGNKSF